MTDLLGYILYYGIYKPYSALNQFVGLLTANTFDISKYPVLGERTIENLFNFYGYRTSEAVAAILWFQIILLIAAIILLRKQRKTQKMLRELNEKLDKLQPPSDPDELNTEDTESAE